MVSNQQFALVSRADPIEIEASDTPNIREQVTSIFESYACLYPNPSLAQENEERDKLLRAVSAADHALRVNPKKKKRRWGWFGGGEDDVEAPHKKVVVVEDDERLKYTEAENESDWLLGTEVSLDTSNIPEEAYAVARKQLCSARPNLVRNSWEAKGATTLLLTGLGSFVECSKNERMIQYTADRDQLLKFADQLHEDPNGVVSCARATTIGPNFLSVSWGFKQDGRVIFYRRLETTSDVVWEPVGVFEPTKAVQDSLFDLFLDEDSHMSALLSISDLTPLVVEFSDQAPVATLAVARLGGFLELVPLPPQMWYGPPIKAPKRPKSRPSDHFAERLPKVMDGVLALTTADYHTDVVGLEAFRTTVDPDNSVWDQELYPYSHPAEHVLAAFGCKNGSQVITFWSVSTLIDEKGISLHADLAEALDMGKIGPDVSIFASPTILRHWRKPRQVELRMNEEIVGSKAPRVTTLSVPAPILGLRFLVENSSVKGALLDYNGGVTLLDCDLLERAASQTLSAEEHQLIYQNENENEIVQLVKVIRGHSEIRQSISCSGDTMPPFALNIQWFRFEAMQSDPGLAIMTRDLLSLRLLRPFSESGLQTTVVPFPDFESGALHKFKNSSALCLVLQGSRINFCSVQELGPSDIVQALVRSSQFRDAVASAERLTVAEQDSIASLIEECKKSIWESERDLDVLESIKDDAYVVMETMVADEDKGSGVVLKGSFDLYRAVGHLALKRIKSARLGASLSIANSIEEVNDIANRIKDRIISLGTYELLCLELSFEPTMEHFHGEFSSASVVDVAKCLAKQSELSALSMVWCRHWDTLIHKHYSVLDDLPLSLVPESYQHLLPISQEGNTDVVAPMFMSGATADSLETLDRLLDYVESLYNISVSLDDRDRELVVERSGFSSDAALGPSNVSPENDESVNIEKWYARRSLAISSFVGCVGHTSYFAELALLALRFDIYDDDLDSSSLSPSVIKLVHEVRFASTMVDLASEQSDTRLVAQLASLDTESFEAMETEKVISLVMNCSGETVDLNARFRRYLLPLLKERLYENDYYEFVARVDNCLLAFCMDLLRNCTSAENLFSVVQVCANLCKASRTSLEKSSRIIQDKKVIVKLAISIIKGCLEACRGISVSDSTFRDIVDRFWIIYESLPSTIPSAIGSDRELSDLMKKADFLLKDLTLLDICSGWLGSKSASLPLQIDGGTECLRAGNRIVRDLCGSFYRQMGKDVSEKSELDEVLTVVKVLLDDVRAINQQCFDDRLSLKQLLSKHLVSALLVARQIGALGAFLSVAGRDLIDEATISSQVLDVFNEGCHGTGGLDAQNSRASAIACQDVLGEWLPGLRVQFEAMRKYLDASHHISTILESEEFEHFNAGKLQHMDPLDVVDLVLEKAPDCFIRHCRQWVDPAWAQDANESIRLHLSAPVASQGGSPSSGQIALPPLPGQPIFYLANVLGLNDKASVIAVKTLVISYGIKNKLYGASAAVCRTLSTDIAGSKADPLPLLDAVGKLVSTKEFGDKDTKAELCSLVLTLRDEISSVQKSDLLSSILSTWNKAKHRQVIAKKSSHGLATTFFQFYLEIQKEYSADLGDLFRTLYFQLSDCVVDDALLKALARFSIFWCISRGTRPVRAPLDSFRLASTDAVLALAASLLLHIQDREFAGKSLRELSEIFSKQNAASQGKNGSLALNWTTPNPHIVNALVGRGYSQCGALRATAMTNSFGVNEALQWAVTHSLDPGFDDPILLVQSMQPILDQDSAKRLDEMLGTLQQVLSGSISLESIFDLSKQDWFGHLSTRAEIRNPVGKVGRLQGRASVDSQYHNQVNGEDGNKARSLPTGNTSNDQQMTDGWDEADDIFDSNAFPETAPVKVPEQPVRSSIPGEVSEQPMTDPQDSVLPSSNEDRGSRTLLNGLPKVNKKTPAGQPKETIEASFPTKEEDVRDKAAQSASKNIDNEVSRVGAKSKGLLKIPKTASGTKKGLKEAPRNNEPENQQKMTTSGAHAGPSDSPVKSHVEPNGFLSSKRSNSGLKVPVKSKSPPKLKINIPSRTRESAATPSSKSPFRLGSPTIPTPPPSSADRATLLKVGQEAFRSARASSPTRQNERQRLMEEGRQLLQKTRSLSSEDPFPYSLRSRGPPPPSPATEKSKSEKATNETNATAYSLRSRGPPPAPPGEQKTYKADVVEKGNGWDDFDDLDI